RQLVVAALRDVSARKELEYEHMRLLQREQAARADAEAALRLRDAFVATVVHDLRQPLATIQMRAKLIDEVAADLTPKPTADRIREWAGGVSRTSNRMTTILDELLDLSHLQLGQRLRLSRRVLDLRDVVRRVVNEYPPADQARISVHVPVQPLVGVW